MNLQDELDEITCRFIIGVAIILVSILVGYCAIYLHDYLTHGPLPDVNYPSPWTETKP